MTDAHIIALASGVNALHSAIISHETASVHVSKLLLRRMMRIEKTLGIDPQKDGEPDLAGYLSRLEMHHEQIEAGIAHVKDILEDLSKPADGGTSPGY
ncbi:MAG: hypothetical protein EON58_11425 [Alphaproteobacteria bacterium]|nr:MAG: hypothetical protein EON58_11425 [Alphaproteobacteria bacterium]